MSRLPQGEHARVAETKVRDYLLNPDNAQNGGKAAQFARFGFQRDAWAVLRDALCLHAIENLVVQSTTSTHGMKFVVECALRSPDGRDPCLRSIWIIDQGGDRPRLVTAY